VSTTTNWEALYDRNPRVYVRLTGSYRCWTWGQCVRCRKNQAGAKLGHDYLHDDLQRSVRKLPVLMLSDRRAAAIHDCRCQCQSESGMHRELHKPATTVSDNLRALVAVAVTMSAIFRLFICDSLSPRKIKVKQEKLLRDCSAEACQSPVRVRNGHSKDKHRRPLYP
jgi:hypothetical protein